MVRGEFESQQALYEYVPYFIPKPIKFGQYVSDPRTFFYLCEFIEMTEEVPRPRDFCASLADLHNRSMGENDKFGFPSTRVQGDIPLEVHVEDKWTDFFKKAMRHMIEQEAETHGRSNEIDDLEPALIDKVIPRLLSPLETGDECITPCLVHGDLWDGNASVSVVTGHPYVFGSCALWAHNECKQTLKTKATHSLIFNQMTWHFGVQYDTSLVARMSTSTRNMLPYLLQLKTGTTETLFMQCKVTRQSQSGVEAYIQEQ